MWLVCSMKDSAQRLGLRSSVSTLRRGAAQAFWKGVVPSLVMVSNPRRAPRRTLTLAHGPGCLRAAGGRSKRAAGR
jgi:hypothetical protein